MEHRCIPYFIFYKQNPGGRVVNGNSGFGIKG